MANRHVGVITMVAALFVAATIVSSFPTRAQDSNSSPVFGQHDAIAQGRRVYRTRCYICHLSNGGRGPNLFTNRLTDEQFMEIVINGRGTMPALGTILVLDDVWNVLAYVKTTDHYE